MKKVTENYKELEAQVKELFEMSLPFEDKMKIYDKLSRKLERTRRRESIRSVINGIKLYIRIARMEHN